ncbi:MAG TPA: RNA polymerase factor sigma-54 [Spirochaetota bacterium]|nr:RNA polymerase factor sigma-54 [Spirochaetota bacterium]
MAVSIKIGLQQTQRLALTQSQLQSIELLQLSSIELVEAVSKELLENPVLEEEYSTAVPPSANGDGAAADGVSRELSGDESIFARREEKSLSYHDEGDSGYVPGHGDEDRARSYIENAVAQEETLKEHLLAQALMVSRDEREFALFEAIITSIDERGLLVADIDEIAESQGVGPGPVREAIRTIGAFDPPGCAASSMKESLLFQAESRYPDDRVLHAILRDHFAELERLDYGKIARALSITSDEIVEKTRLIHTLTPFPGRQFAAKDVRYIVPDAEVRYVDGEILITVNDDYIPPVRINRYYVDMMKKKNIDKNLREFIKDRVQSARSLLRSISSRRDTIARVVAVVMQRQVEFLLKGPGNLRPLTHTEVADELGLHESTVSRTTSNKFVQTPWGVFELKYFFASRLRSGDPDDYSSNMIINMVKEIIAGEDASRPLNDDEILALLGKRGIRLARRTIAKYRGILHIPPSNKRKKLNMLRSEGKA